VLDAGALGGLGGFSYACTVAAMNAMGNGIL
jgi:hypothetical protein